MFTISDYIVYVKVMVVFTFTKCHCNLCVSWEWELKWAIIHIIINAGVSHARPGVIPCQESSSTFFKTILQVTG